MYPRLGEMSNYFDSDGSQVCQWEGSYKNEKVKTRRTCGFGLDLDLSVWTTYTIYIHTFYIAISKSVYRYMDIHRLRKNYRHYVYMYDLAHISSLSAGIA